MRTSIAYDDRLFPSSKLGFKAEVYNFHCKIHRNCNDKIKKPVVATTCFIALHTGNFTVRGYEQEMSKKKKSPKPYIPNVKKLIPIFSCGQLFHRIKVSRMPYISPVNLQYLLLGTQAGTKYGLKIELNAPFSRKDAELPLVYALLFIESMRRHFLEHREKDHCCLLLPPGFEEFEPHIRFYFGIGIRSAPIKYSYNHSPTETEKKWTDKEQEVVKIGAQIISDLAKFTCLHQKD